MALRDALGMIPHWGQVVALGAMSRSRPWHRQNDAGPFGVLSFTGRASVGAFTDVTGRLDTLKQTSSEYRSYTCSSA
jgi:hypothetical protein